MASITLTDDEAKLLRVVLATLVVKDRTAELGILHGLDRFVSTQHVLKKLDRERLDAIAKKLGLSNGVTTYRG